MNKVSWHDFKSQLTRQAEAKRVPISGIFELTARCNLQCRMCYICKPAADSFSKNVELDTNDWLNIATEARDSGMLFVILTGGEVFVRTDFDKIYEGIIDIGLIPTIYSNATLINQQKIRWLKKLPPEKLEVTLYGASAESYSKVCGNEWAYEKVIANIDALLDAGIELRLKTTVIEENKNDYELLKRFADDRGIPLQFCFYISPKKVDAVSNNFHVSSRLPPAEISDYMRRASREYCDMYRGSTDTEKDIRGQVANKESGHLNLDSPFHCPAGKTDVWLTWRGYMAGCGLMPEICTEPLKYGFNKAWLDLENKLKVVPACSQCFACDLRGFCLSCPARLKNETGYYDKPAEYLCDFARQQAKHYG